MSVKLLILKSYEDVIAEVTEIFNGIKVTHYELSNPYVTRLDTDKVTFYPYAALSKDKVITISTDWVVTVVEPLDELKTSYLEKLNAKLEDSNPEE
jgi:DNA/RNA-binding domain of Phe-tRNA-synthetase-like protein